ncbi:MAG: DUF6056 family protein [Acetobacter sp.]|uniref:DUF6056 family protein n=1 Tax=Acetobacter sp. TaxID=440 RepID=UPI0039E86AA7
MSHSFLYTQFINNKIFLTVKNRLNINQKNISSFCPHAIGLALCFLFVAWANIMTPLWSDDYCRIEPFSLTSPFLNAWRDYFQWTGRYFTTVITFFVVSSLPSWWMDGFDLLNAAIFTVLIDTVLYLGWIANGAPARSDKHVRTSIIDVVVVGILLWWLPRAIGEVALWKTGAIGYLWPVTGEFWLFKQMLEQRVVKRHWLAAFAFFIATFLEPLSLVMSIIFVSYGLLRWRQKEAVPYGVIVGQILGTATVLAAPGNFVRAASMHHSSMHDHISGVISNLGGLFDGYWLAAIVLIALCFTQYSGRAVLAFKATHGLYFIVFALLYMVTLLGVPREALAPRVSFPASVFLICYVTTLFLQRPVGDHANSITGGLVFTVVIVHLLVSVSDLTRVASISRAWAANPQLRMGPKMDAVLPLVKWGNTTLYVRKDIMFAGLTANSNYFINTCYAHAHGVRSVSAR